MNESRKSLVIALSVLILAIAVVGVIGILALRPEPEILEGAVEASEYRISGKVPGRIAELRFHEGDKIHEGDTLVVINSPEVEAKLEQAQAAKSAASAQSRKAYAGARQEQISAAYEMWQKAKTGEDIARKSYERVQSLYDKQVVSAQKRDEAEAQYNAAVATANAAYSQYEMAKKGAQDEDKAAANALVSRAAGAISEVESYMNERFLLAPADGEIVETYAKIGELVGTGAPIVSVVNIDDVWFTFCVREDLLKDLSVGKEVTVTIPALNRDVKAKVTAVRAMASYATWRATKTNGQYDVKSFEVKMVPLEKVPDLRPGMTTLLKDSSK